MIGDRATARERRLAIDAALAEALLERATESGPESARSALELLEDWAVPIAVLDVARGAPRLVNAAWRARFGARDPYAAIPGLDEAARSGSVHHVARLAVEREGQPAWCAATTWKLHAIAGVIVVCADIADDVPAHDAERDELLARERAARAEAEEANRLKDQFLATVSHELRTPLTTIVLWEAILRDEVSEPALRAKALDAIRQSVLVQSRVVGDLLDISRAISGKLYVDLRPVELEHVVRGALDTIAPRASAKQVTLERRGTAVAGDVLGDAPRLRQVLDNLLTNAVAVTEPGGRITLAVSSSAASVAIAVSDTGCGIAPAFLGRMFEPFSQVDDPARRTAGGLGLGLAISRKLVELHRGTLVAASAGRGCGATFTVTLPAVDGRDPPIVRRTPQLGRARVLVIDDDLRVLEALAVLLGRAGAEVETAGSAQAGRERIARRHPDVVVCDIAMPVEDGYAFMRAVRASGSSVQAIALTAHATETDVARSLAAGFDRHLAKPIDFERLVVSIDELVRSRAP